jgi:hypothetical protein
MVTIKEDKADDALLATAALAAILIAGTVMIGTGQISLADTVDRNNAGIDVPTNTNQIQACKTTGNNSPITGTGSGSCTAGSSNSIAENGGDTMATTEEGSTKTSTPSSTTEFLTFVECSGTNGNHNVHCTVHDSGITDINCNVANPAISGGNNVGDRLTNNGIHLTCVIPPQPGLFPCTRP